MITSNILVMLYNRFHTDWIWTCYDSSLKGTITSNISPRRMIMATHDTISAWFWMTNSWLSTGGLLFFLRKPIALLSQGMNTTDYCRDSQVKQISDKFTLFSHESPTTFTPAYDVYRKLWSVDEERSCCCKSLKQIFLFFFLRK